MVGFKYMGKISTIKGFRWFYLGDCADTQDAWKKAEWMAVKRLGGSRSQVKEVMPKIEWIKNVRPTK